MSGLFFGTLFFIISSSFALNSHAKICVKEVTKKYTIYKFDANIRSFVPKDEFSKKIIFVCCEGYRENGHIKEFPNCVPICKQSCGYGYCERPNICNCYYGFVLSDGTCKHIENNEVTTTSKLEKEVELSSTFATSTTKQFKGLITETTQEVVTLQDSNNLFTAARSRSMSIIPPLIERIIKPASLTTEDDNVGLQRSTSVPPMGTDHLTLESKSMTTLVPSLEITEKTESSTKRIVENSTLITGDNKLHKVSNFYTKEPESSELSDLDIETRSTSFKHQIPANCDGSFCFCRMGYKLFEEKFCRRCPIGSQCECQDGYAFDSISCKPLCNEALDGCTLGTCVEFNVCRCDNGTKKHKNDLFRCQVEETTSFLHAIEILPKWCLWLLIIPATIAFLSLCIISKRSRTSKLNRLNAQKNIFHEIRYYSSYNGQSSSNNCIKTDGTTQHKLNLNGDRMI